MDETRDTDPMNLKNPIAARRAQPEDRHGGGDQFVAPLGSSRKGRLRFTNGAHGIAISANSRMRDLCRARFRDQMPTIWVQEGVVIIRYPRVPSCDWLGYRSERPAEVELNARVSWDIEVHGGASKLVADLRGLRFGSLSLNGGISRVEVVLPEPVGTVAVVILGGASNVAIHRSVGVAARLRVGGGTTNLKFDDRSIGVAGGELDLLSKDYTAATSRYDVSIRGGANNVSVGMTAMPEGRSGP